MVLQGSRLVSKLYVTLKLTFWSNTEPKKKRMTIASRNHSSFHGRKTLSLLPL